MPNSPRRALGAPLLLLTACASLALTGCITPPAVPTSAPSGAPTSTAAPSGAPTETSAAPTPSASAAPSAAPGDIPELVAIGTELPPGTVGGWETSIITDDAFEVQPDSDFPAGPTISVVETATGCTFWAYQGAADSDSTDEAESSAATLALLSSSSPDDWDPDVFTLDRSASQGAAVEMLSIVQEVEGDPAKAWYARNFQSGGTTSSIMAMCPAGTGGIDHIDEVIIEHLQINFLVP
ncbi:hypothetical protein [Agrococcus sp. Marseille-P2731]|uniref:hypothetical protein n=1 Tax=Agrococcus sp. Marseille-P2731 TaxID=1841862 RepID=UPI000930538F|nr:hypothetical protein [Agrococcus sp. Marseille-P2731]